MTCASAAFIQSVENHLDSRGKEIAVVVIEDNAESLFAINDMHILIKKAKDINCSSLHILSPSMAAEWLSRHSVT
jgi:hypothetical protein